MAEYNAGSIEGTLDIDTDPFVAGLLRAKQQAEEFERHVYEARLRVKKDSDRLNENPDLGSATDASVGLDTSGFDAGAARVEAELAILDKSKAEPKVDLDTDPISRKLQGLRGDIDRANGDKGGDGGFGGFGMAGLVSLVISLAAALGPATSAVGLFASAGVVGFGRMAVTVGLWAAVMKGAVGELTEAIKKGEMLPGMAGKAQVAIVQMQGAWQGLRDAIGDGLYENVIKFSNTITEFLPKLAPMLDAISEGMLSVNDSFAALVSGGPMQTFLDTIEKSAPENLKMIGEIGRNSLEGILGLFTAFDPVIHDMLGWLEDISADFNEWANNKGIKAIQDWFDKVKQDGPAIKDLFGSLGSALGAIFEGIAPLVGPAMSFFTTLFETIGKIDFTPLTEGFGAILTGLEPIIKVLGTVINDLLPVFGAAFEKLGPALAEMGDAFAKLWPIIKPIVTFLLGIFLDSIVGIVKGITKIIQGITLVFQGVIDFVTGVFTGDWGKAWDGIVKILQGAWKLLVGIVEVALNWGIFSIFRKAGKKIITWFSDTFLKAPAKIFKDAFKAATKAGGNILDGLWGGMKAVWKSISKWWKGIISGGIIGTIRDFLDMHSPSRVMHSLGENTMLGLYGGMKNTWASKITPFMLETAKGLQSAFDDVSLSLGGGTLTVSKTPLQSAVDALREQVASAQSTQSDLASALEQHASDVGEAMTTQNDANAKMVTDAFEKASEKNAKTVLEGVRKK